jgi:hypothetical protein
MEPRLAYAARSALLELNSGVRYVLRDGQYPVYQPERFGGPAPDRGGRGRACPAGGSVGVVGGRRCRASMAGGRGAAHRPSALHAPSGAYAQMLVPGILTDWWVPAGPSAAHSPLSLAPSGKSLCSPYPAHSPRTGSAVTSIGAASSDPMTAGSEKAEPTQPGSRYPRRGARTVRGRQAPGPGQKLLAFGRSALTPLRL